jgi:hypothetical protein
MLASTKYRLFWLISAGRKAIERADCIVSPAYTHSHFKVSSLPFGLSSFRAREIVRRIETAFAG